MIQTLVLLISYAFAASPVTVTLEQMSDVTHVEFSGREAWDYKLQKEANNAVSIEVDKIDDKSIVLLKTLQSPLVDHVEVQDGVNLKQKLVFFLKDQKTQGFDYITEQPSRLVVDFYNDDAKTKNVAEKTPSSKLPKKKLAAKDSKNNRKPASEFLAQNSSEAPKEIEPSNLDGADPEYQRFQIADYEIKDAAIIASKLNLYIRYPMMEVPINDLKEILDQKPKYEVEDSKDDETQKARLLLTLFNKPRPAVFLKTLDLFRDEYPNSKYKEELASMEADMYYSLWLDQKKVADFDTSINLYTKIALSEKNSPLHDRTMRLIAYSYLDHGNYMIAYTSFQKYINQYPESPYKFRVQIAMAECLSKLNNTADAFKIYSQIEDDKKAGPFAVEAAFRKGDIYAQTQDYPKAISEYERALKKYNTFAKDYPNAVYNSAESRFWEDRERKNLQLSLNGYIDFLKKYPKNEHASFAMERIGELLEILGAPEKRFNGTFIESIYRYGDTEAAGIAKIRILRSRIPLMKDKEIEQEISEFNKFEETSQLEKLKEFKTIMIADGYYAKKDYDKALKYLIGFYQNNPLSNTLPVFKKRIVQTFKDEMSHAVDQKDYLKSFQIYGKNANVWLKDSGRIDIEYLLGRAFEEAAVPDEAVKKYQDVLNKLYSIKGTQEEKERQVFEDLPTIDSMNLRLASIYTFKNEYGKALNHLKEIKDTNLSDNDRVEKVYLASEVYEKLNQPEYAIKNLKSLTETWRGEPEKLSAVYFRLAKLESESGQSENALKALNQLLDMSKDSQSVSDQDQIAAMELKAKISADTKKMDQAIVTYKNLLERFEDKYPLYSDRFELGKLYFQKGEVKDAEKIWSPLQDKPDAQVWSKLAQENLKNSNWTDEYKKYTTRIPAMVDDGQQKGNNK